MIAFPLHLAPELHDIEEVEGRMRSGWGGMFQPFLGEHTSLAELLRKDATAVAGLNLTMSAFSEKVNNLFDRPWEELPYHEQSHHDFLFSPPCPICGEEITRVCVPHTTEVILVERGRVKRAGEIAALHGQRCYTQETFSQLIMECGALIVPELFRHSIERHGFFGGAYPYRTEPRALAAAVGLIPMGTN